MKNIKWLLPAAGFVLVAGFALADGADGQKVYESKCAKCHGVNGDGAGKFGKLLNPKPTNFSDSKWQANRTDEQIVSAIKLGSKAPGLKISQKMTAFDKKLSDGQIQSLVTVVRGFGKATVSGGDKK